MSTNTPKKPGWFLFTLGVLYPTGVILFEWIGRFCAGIFFDPLPTFGHVLLVLLVPAANALLWWQLRENRWRSLTVLRWLSLVAIGVAIYYSFVFLPLAPFAVVAIVFYGIGLLPLAPIAALIVAVILYRRFYRCYEQQLQPKTQWWKGAGVGVLLLMLLDIPAAATTWGATLASSTILKDRQLGLSVLRTVGDEDLLLRMCYNGSRQVLGPWTLASIIIRNSAGGPSQTEAREIYYRVTGRPFSTVPVPYEGGSWSRFDDFQFDPDLGGVQVGGRIRGLHLLSSRMDGSVNADEGFAYTEWTFEFQNDSAVQREVRLEVALPPDSVVSRASLWINGEEREAAFAKQSKVRAAYERIVSRRRDPLLVTTAGPDRVLAQAFPIPQHGGTIKFKLGITTPLFNLTETEGALLLPAITDRNFNIGDEVKHAVWFEGRHPLAVHGPGEHASVALPNNTFRWQAQLGDEALSLQRVKLVSQRSPAFSTSSASVNNVEVVQQLTRGSRAVPDAVVLVVDGSVSMRQHVAAIERSLEHIPASLPVGLMLASDGNKAVTLAPWDDAQKLRGTELLRPANFEGGQDNTTALVNAIAALERYQRPLVIWIHGAQPVAFANSGALLDQSTERSSRLPELVLLNLQAGPNSVLQNSNWQWWAKTWPHAGNTEESLQQLLSHYLNGGASFAMSRHQVATSSEKAEGSAHLVRLWANEKIKSLMRGNQANADEALALANDLKLVTPLSGAVVLETAADYAQNGLQPVDPGAVPTIPEPGQWAIIITLMLMMLWLLKTRRIKIL